MNPLIQQILREKLIVIVRGVERQQLLPLAQALYDGGIRLMEVTYDAAGNIPDTEIADRIRMLASHFAGDMQIGAGTVLNPAQVEYTAEAGGGFIISPNTDPVVIRRTGELGLVSIPGALTPTEIMEAYRAGADFVKLFPVSTLGPAYVKAVAAPLSQIRLMAVGGVTADNAPQFLAAGACGIGVGSDLTSKKLLENGDYAAITALARKYIQAIR